MIPTVDDLQSAPLTKRYGDLFAAPGLTNFLGCVQVGLDLTGLHSLNFPPFGTADVPTASLYLDPGSGPGQAPRLFHAHGAPITFRWWPDRIVREAEVSGLHLRSTTALARGRMAAVMTLEVENRSGSEREVTLRLGVQGSVTQARRRWNAPLPPHETGHEATVDAGRGAVRFRATQSEAVQIQGTAHAPDVLRPVALGHTLRLAPGETGRIDYVHAIGATDAEAEATYDALIHDVPAELARVRADWNAELQAVFTPGNDRYSGHLPELHTTDDAIAKLYHMGALGVVYFKRDSPYSVHGRAYDTLLPRYWQSVTFLWDYFLSSPVHAQLDPAVMRGYLDRWMHLDVHSHFGTEYLTGQGVGNWYAVNDFAMVSMASTYVRWTGDHAWLTSRVEGSDERVIDALRRYATNWRRFKTGSGLADYGGLNNLLECVHTYLHEVASLNAANVFNLREVTRLLAFLGEPDDGALVGEAAQILRDVQQLYVPGRGYWQARFPDGSLRDVRHCYDLLTVLNTIPDDLTAAQKAEMVAFFQRELQTPTWMHALSPGDEDAFRDVRPDHQWNGAYPAWPPETARGLYRIGEADLAFRWLQGLAKTTNQGPYGQAHFVEVVWPTTDGAATKVPPDEPYINDWTCSSNGSYVNVVIESIFGVRPGLGGPLTAQPQFGPFDPSAELHNVTHQGTRYHITRDGARVA
ncbi:MAG: hypothetical protein AAF809_02030 [Bacteroidota bacterium]